MNEIFYEMLENAGYVKGDEVNDFQIDKAKVSKIIDIAEQSVEITSAKNLKRGNSALSHSASLSLSGGRESCYSLNCRMSRVYQLAQFASLYSDRVYIRNFLSDFSPHWGADRWDDLILKRSFKNDLIILNEIRPLVERGRIVIFTPPLDCCPTCLARSHLGKDAGERLRKEYKVLLKRYLREISYRLSLENRKYFMDLAGPDLLLEHGGQTIEMSELPTEIMRNTKITNKLDKKKTVSLSKKIVEELGLNQVLALRVMENIAFELTVSQSFNASFLTEKDLHIELLNALSENEERVRRNQIAQRYLSTIVPFYDGVPIRQLIMLRDKEAEAFLVYRKMLNEAIDEYRKQGNKFTEREAQAIYADIIEPSLAKLDMKLKSAKRSLLKEESRRILSWVGAISFGIYAGFVPSDLVMAAKALGLTKVVAEIVGSAMKLGEIDGDIRKEEVYFLWKVRELSKIGLKPKVGKLLSTRKE
ncbi:MAG: hypothetical protein ABSH06_28515 [Thermodesulfobacteriota bacterium]